MMNTLQIDKILSGNPITREAYIGCFAGDQIFMNKIFTFPCCLVVNIDPSTSKGSHWVGIFCISPKQLEYYDSLGIWSPVSPYITRFLRNFSKIRYTKIGLQSVSSNACGLHVIFFLYNRCMGVSFERIVRFLHFSKQSPDDFVKTFVHNIILK